MYALQNDIPTDAQNPASSEPSPGETQPVANDACFQSKCLKTLQATAALAGYRLEKIGTGFFLQRWGCVIHCTDLDTVEAQFRRVEARQ
jgi:hypothetical protein